MKYRIVILSGIILMAIASCNKKDSATSEADFNTMKTTVLKDFTNNIALSNYQALDAAATSLYTSINNLNANATEANLSQAKTDWLNMRTVWEQAEGFLFGPVEDNSYDPNMDTWPTDFNEVDSLLASSSALEVSDLQSVPSALRGYHPIEYIIFGNHGSRAAATITARQKKYMISLVTDLKDICHSLYTSWSAAPTNYANEIINAGNGSTIYTKKQQVYLALVGGMTDICDEVGTGKMKDPYDAFDSTIVESPYSGNSLIDFKNNIIGLQNVYMGTYAGVQGLGIKDLVAAKNKSLDNKIQAEIAAAVSSFANVTIPYEEAIFSQRVQVANIMNSLATLNETLESELTPFIKQYIQD
jgi:putative iron-regulated protein